MSWTDERVARLSKLWAEGLSASQIATELGGVTRNAVIGKVHRLGLSGRAKSTAGGRPKRAAAEAAQPATHSTARQPASVASVAAAVAQRANASPSAGGARASSGGAHTMGATALKMEPEFEAEAETEIEPRHQEAADVVVPMSKRLTLLEVNDTTCKWPTGDPQRPDFSFCGHGVKEGTPYCEFHAKLAFQPPSDRRRRR